MKKYFRFVREPHNFTARSVIYVVAVGKSRAEQTKLALVKEYCKDVGFYFQSVSPESDKAIELLKDRIRGNCPRWRFFFRTCKCTINELYAMIIDDTFAQVEDNLTEQRGFFLFKSYIDPNFYFQNQSKKVLLSCHPSGRKHLSQKGSKVTMSAIINFGLILALFLAAGWLEGHQYLFY